MTSHFSGRTTVLLRASDVSLSDGGGGGMGHRDKMPDRQYDCVAHASFILKDKHSLLLFYVVSVTDCMSVPVPVHNIRYQDFKASRGGLSR